MDREIQIPFADSTLPGLLRRPDRARWLYVLAHGAGAGMTHRFLEEIATALADVDVATLRWNMPYMAAGRRRPDPSAVCEAAVRAACAEAERRQPDLRRCAGGKSMGGRMSSRAQSEAPLPIEALIFLGFPLHPAKEPSTSRADHLAKVALPMLFLQGTRDDLAELPLLRPIVASLGDRARLVEIEGADHGFDVLVRSGRKHADVIRELAETIARWLAAQNES